MVVLSSIKQSVMMSLIQTQSLCECGQDAELYRILHEKPVIHDLGE